MVAGSSSIPKSDYFALVEAGDGIWAALATEWLNALGNAVIIDMGGRTLIVDTFASARVAHELRAAARSLTGCETAWVANTHFHADHTGGNEVFASEATIAATAKCRQYVVRSSSVLAKRIDACRARIADLPSGDEPELVAGRKSAAAELDYLERLNFIAPTATIGDRLTLHGDKRRAELIPIGTAHTTGDMIVHLPDDRIVASGDAVLVKTHVYAGDGNILTWPAALKIIRDLAPRTLIPGHGGVGGGSDIDEMDAYVTELAALAEAGAGSAGSAEVPEIPERFRDWGWSEGWADAVKAAAAHLAASRG
jgi:cyclase